MIYTLNEIQLSEEKFLNADSRGTIFRFIFLIFGGAILRQVNYSIFFYQRGIRNIFFIRNLIRTRSKPEKLIAPV